MDEPTLPVDPMPGLPSWTLCIATMNRGDVLLLTLGFALAQTVPPGQIVIVDASDDWASSAVATRAVGAAAGVEVVHVVAEARSSARQRNQGVALSDREILFVIDDDTFMYPDCAAEILSLYAADTQGRIAAIGASPTSTPPSPALTGIARQSKSLGGRKAAAIKSLSQRSRIMGFLIDEVLMMSAESRGIRYDFEHPHHGPEAFAALAPPDAFYSLFIFGYQLTVRRSIAMKEPFDPGLLGYSPNEDMDATYRYNRHGLNINATKAKVHHFGSAAARTNIFRVCRLSLCNTVYFARRNGQPRLRAAVAVTVFVARMLPALFLRDLIARRWRFERFFGSLAAVPDCVRILCHGDENLVEWYQARQAHILGKPLDAYIDWQRAQNPGDAAIMACGPTPQPFPNEVPR